MATSKSEKVDIDIIKRVLILGAGFVSHPAVEYLSRDKTLQVTVVSQFSYELDDLCKDFLLADTVVLDVQEKLDVLQSLISANDVVVSLLPSHLQLDIAKTCIKHKTNMLTASYVSPAMQALHDSAKDADVAILNEVGVDPGIDHMIAMQCFDEVKNDGGKITSYISWCGGLPAPECSNVPLHYKFSWSPRGVLMNCLNGAKYRLNDKVVEIGDNGGLLDAAVKLQFMPGFALEGFPNRDSTSYGKTYGINSASTILRGTIRYEGFSRVVKGLMTLGLFDSTPHSNLHPNGPDLSWKSFLCDFFGKSPDILEDSLKDLVYEKVNRDEYSFQSIIELGLLDDKPIDKQGTPLNTLCNYLAKRLSYGPNERDMLLLHHDIQIQWPDKTLERRQYNLVNYGDVNGYSAMAKTVGLTIAIATKMILEGEIQTKGIVKPLTPDIYKPILSRLKQEGISAEQTIA